jgi:hypothetical protein
MRQVLVRRTQFVWPKLARETHRAHPCHAGPHNPKPSLAHSSFARLPPPSQFCPRPRSVLTRVAVRRRPSDPRHVSIQRDPRSPGPRCPRAPLQRFLPIRSCLARNPTAGILPDLAHGHPGAAIKGGPIPQVPPRPQPTQAAGSRRARTR